MSAREDTWQGGIIITSLPSLVSPRDPTKGIRKTKKGVLCCPRRVPRGGEVALLRLFLYRKTKAACLRAVNAIRYPPQDPAMMRLEKKKKPVTELAVIAVVSQNKNRKSRKSDKK